MTIKNRRTQDYTNGGSHIVDAALGPPQGMHNRNIASYDNSHPGDDTHAASWTAAENITDVTIVCTADSIVLFNALDGTSAAALIGDPGAVGTDVFYAYIPALTPYRKTFKSPLRRVDVELVAAGTGRCVIDVT